MFKSIKIVLFCLVASGCASTTTPEATFSKVDPIKVVEPSNKNLKSYVVLGEEYYM